MIVELGMATIANSTIINNSAPTSAGIRVSGGTLVITNSTIANNSAIGSNGFGGGTASISNSTIAHNSASESGGGLRNSDGSPVELQNTILAENMGGSGGPDCFVAANPGTSLGNNLIGNLSDCPITLLSTDLIGSPGLGPFMDDGTPGNGHFPLLSTSRAIDAGNDAACPPTDQLDQPRVGRCDIGAIEFQGTPVLTVAIDIKPGDDLNCFNNNERGVIPVAILSSTDFNAAEKSRPQHSAISWACGQGGWQK